MVDMSNNMKAIRCRIMRALDKNAKYLQRAFSLVETLVAITVVVVIAALLFPVFNAVRDCAQTTMCLSNLRQLSNACLLYSGDNDNRLIPIDSGTSGSDAQTWRFFLQPYLPQSKAVNLANAFICPTDSSTGGKGSIKLGADPQGLRPSSYGMHESQIGLNSLHESIYLRPSCRATAIKNPGFNILLCDLGLIKNYSAPVSQWVSTAGGNFGYVRMPDDAGISGDPMVAFPRHRSRTKLNAAFYDGHAESLDWKSDILANPRGSLGCRYDNH